MARQSRVIWDTRHVGDTTLSLDQALDRALDLLNRIRDALGTEETGENLVTVARNSHLAEQELATFKRRFREGMTLEAAYARLSELT